MTDDRHVVLNVPDISCHHCKMAIEKALAGVDGVSDVDVEVEAKTVGLHYDAACTGLDAVEQVMADEGYPVAGRHEFEG
jgi:copper chaperone